MGLLGDYLPDWLPDDPNKADAMRAGLLSFGAAMMQGRGNFGNALGGSLQAGAQGYGNAMEEQQKAALQAMQTKRYSLENQGMQSAIDRPKRLQDILNGQSDIQPPQAMPQTSMPTGSSPQSTQSVMPLSQLPTMQASSMPPSMPPSVAIPQGSPQSIIDRYRSYGDKLSAAGEIDAANKYYDLAEKMKPKLKDQSVMMGPDNKPVSVMTYEDGTQKTSTYGAKPDIQILDLGGKSQVFDKNIGVNGQTFDKSQTPDSVANNAVAMRGQNMVDARAKDSVGKVDPMQTENIASMIATGRMAPLGQMAMRSPAGVAIMSRVAELNPDFRAQTFGTGSKAEKDFATGKQGNSVRSFNVSLSHLDTLGNLADALHNKDAQAVNKIGNYFSEQTGNPAPTNFDAAKKVVADEIVKAIVGSGGGVADREEAARTIAKANSPAQLKGVISTYKELMNGQLGGLELQYKSTTGRDDFNKYLSPQAQAARHTGQAPAPAGAPAAGTVKGGYVFKGGNPSDKNNWEKQ